jgi:nucleotide-binding universal stress UspA family protein
VATTLPIADLPRHSSQARALAHQDGKRVGTGLARASAALAPARVRRRSLLPAFAGPRVSLLAKLEDELRLAHVEARPNRCQRPGTGSGRSTAVAEREDAGADADVIVVGSSQRAPADRVLAGDIEAEDWCGALGEHEKYADAIGRRAPLGAGPMLEGRER